MGVVPATALGVAQQQHVGQRLAHRRGRVDAEHPGRHGGDHLDALVGSGEEHPVGQGVDHLLRTRLHAVTLAACVRDLSAVRE
jgi:hypothetical protein